MSWNPYSGEPTTKDEAELAGAAHAMAKVQANGFPFPPPHVCPVPRPPEPPKFGEVLRLAIRPEFRNKPMYQAYSPTDPAPELPTQVDWFNDVYMVARTAALSGKLVRVRCEYDCLVVEVEK